MMVKVAVPAAAQPHCSKAPFKGEEIMAKNTSVKGTEAAEDSRDADARRSVAQEHSYG
jgi:hypothetical protein